METAQASVSLKDAPVQFYVQDISFAMPQRKKLTLEVTAGYLRTRNQATKEVEFGISMEKIRELSCHRTKLRLKANNCCVQPGHALCLPVPEKTQKQFNFCIIPEFADGITPPPEGTSPLDPMVFTVADGPAKAAFSGSGQQIGNNPGETAEALIRKLLNDNMPNTNVVRPDEREFVSATPEAHRKGEKAYHVKAFRGSKEGMSRHGAAVGNEKPSSITNSITRLSIPALDGNLVCFQEAASFLLVRYGRISLLYIRSPAYVQPEHHCSSKKWF